jgi:hypothetical protein
VQFLSEFVVNETHRDVSSYSFLLVLLMTVYIAVVAHRSLDKLLIIHCIQLIDALLTTAVSCAMCTYFDNNSSACSGVRLSVRRRKKLSKQRVNGAHQ